MSDVLPYNETEQLSRIAEGDEDAFSSIFHQYRNRIFTVAFKLTGSAELAEEIVQDVFLKIWLKREKLNEIRNLSAFLFIVARNESFSCLRRIAREESKGKQLEAWAPSNTSPADSGLIEKEIADLLNQAVGQLSSRQREIYILNKEEGLKRDEIAAKLNLSSETVKAHLGQALKSIRAYCITRLPFISFIFLTNYFLKR